MLSFQKTSASIVCDSRFNNQKKKKKRKKDSPTKALWKFNIKSMYLAFKSSVRFQLILVITARAMSEERPRIKCS